MRYLKTLILTLLKLILAVSLISWLVRSGKMNLSELSRFTQDWLLTLAVLSYWSVAACIWGTWRWKTLLAGAGFQLQWPRALQLQTTGFFFNTVMPGAVGGDLIKLAYVIRDNRDKPKTQAMMTVLLDRIVGLSGLFLIGWLFMLPSLGTLTQEPKLIPLVGLMGLISLGFMTFYLAALYHYKGRDPFLRFLSLPVPGFSIIYKLYTALRAYRYARAAIAKSLLLSLLIQGCSLLLFYYISGKVLEGFPEFGKIASIFPLGVLTTAIPVTPGGLGVGHVAFDSLFQMVGLHHGANVFNIFVVSQLALNLLGIIPYLSLRKAKVISEELDTNRAMSAC